MSGYDNLDGSDDAHPACLQDHCGTTDAFLNAVPVVSILASDWSAYKYHYIDINWNGKIGTVQSWDECVNADCPGGEKDCCTANAKLYGGNFLMDVEKHALKNLFGITNYDNVLDKVTYRICGAFDSTPIANKWFGAGNRLQNSKSSSMPVWGWAVLAVGIVAGVLVVVAIVVYVVRKKEHPETV